MIQLRAAVSRRNFLQATATAGAAVACAPGATPETRPTAGGSEPWEREWAQLIDAARKEGSLAVATLAGAGRRKAVEAFQEAFGIAVELQSYSSLSLFVPRLFQERAAGVYAWDVVQSPVASMIGQPRDEGALDPIEPLLIRPDVVEDRYWQDGFAAGLTDSKRTGYIGLETVQPGFYINTDLVPDGLLKSVKDLLDPKWKGKMLFADVRAGQTFLPMLAVRTNLGDDVVKQLIVDQQPIFIRDARQRNEAMVRGQHPIATGIDPTIMQEFREQGLGRNIKHIDLPESRYIAGFGAVFAVNKAPHPNATRLFVNWFLTKEAQTIWAPAIEENSRRVDVPVFDPTRARVPGGKYILANRESGLTDLAATQKFLDDLVAGR